MVVQRITADSVVLMHFAGVDAANYEATFPMIFVEAVVRASHVMEINHFELLKKYLANSTSL